MHMGSSWKSDRSRTQENGEKYQDRRPLAIAAAPLHCPVMLRRENWSLVLSRELGLNER